MSTAYGRLTCINLDSDLTTWLLEPSVRLVARFSKEQYQPTGAH